MYQCQFSLFLNRITNSLDVAKASPTVFDRSKLLPSSRLSSSPHRARRAPNAMIFHQPHEDCFLSPDTFSSNLLAL